MKRYVVVLMVLTWLFLPLVAVADDQSPMPPELNWTPIPPARSTVDATQLTEMLVRKGVLTTIDQGALAKPQAVTPTKELLDMDRQNGTDRATAP